METKRGRGKPIHWDMVLKVKELKGRGLSERAIAKEIGKDRNQIMRWRKLIPLLPEA